MNENISDLEKVLSHQYIKNFQVGSFTMNENSEISRKITFDFHYCPVNNLNVKNDESLIKDAILNQIWQEIGKLYFKIDFREVGTNDKISR